MDSELSIYLLLRLKTDLQISSALKDSLARDGKWEDAYLLLL